jgi:hypothetical protein
MKDRTKRTLFWLPRVLAIVFIVFISLFSLDVFVEGRGFWETLAALVVHLLPTFVLILLLIVAWRREWIGAVLFGLAGVWYTLSILPQSGLSPAAKLNWGMIIAWPAFIIAGLFFFNWLRHDELRMKKKPGSEAGEGS